MMNEVAMKARSITDANLSEETAPLRELP